MSRSAEDQQLLDQRIEAMKRKNEELKRRHLEVEADKQSAAKQNALVQIKSPFDEEWIPGGRHERLEQDKSPNQTSSVSQHNAHHSTEHPRGHNDRQYDSGHQSRENGRHPRDASNKTHVEEPLSRNKHANYNNTFTRGRQSDYQNRRPNSGDWSSSEENRRSRDQPGYGRDNSKNQYKDWSGENRQWPNQNRREEPHPHSRETSRTGGSAPATSSKVFKNSGMDGDRGWKPRSRLAEGDGPPADPQYSFLGDDERDSQEVVERRQGLANRRGSPRGQGFSRGGRSWSNKRYGDSKESTEGDRVDSRTNARSGDNYEAWRRERNKIDEDRINRQKTSDGNWSREWDNNKLYQEDRDRPHTRRGNRGFRQHQGGQGPSETPAGVAQQRMNRMREGHFPGEPGFDSNRPRETFPQPCHDHIRRGRFGSRRGRGPKGYPNQEVEGEPQSPSQDDAPTLSQPHTKSKQETKSKICREPASLASKSNENDDGSWEDVSSDENVSEIAEMKKNHPVDSSSSKTVDVSSGPESLDPIPTSGKEDGFLWDEYHTGDPGGFEDGMVADLNADEVCKAFFEKSKEGQECGDVCPPVPTFKIDTHCLEDSDGEDCNSKLDPLLVTTQLVQAEVDKMSLPSIQSDEVLPSLVDKTVEEKHPEVLEESPVESDQCPDDSVSAEELSGPVSILLVPSPQNVSSDSEASFQSVESPGSPTKDSLGVEEFCNVNPSNESNSELIKPMSFETNENEKLENSSVCREQAGGVIDSPSRDSVIAEISDVTDAEPNLKEVALLKESSREQENESLSDISRAVVLATSACAQPESSIQNDTGPVTCLNMEQTMSEVEILKSASLTDSPTNTADSQQKQDKKDLKASPENEHSRGLQSETCNIQRDQALSSSESAGVPLQLSGVTGQDESGIVSREENIKQDDAVPQVASDSECKNQKDETSPS